MSRRRIYLLAAASGAAFAAAVVVANNFYWGASARPGGDYYLFHRPVPPPFGALLWQTIGPLLVVTPLASLALLYLGVRQRTDDRPGRCRRCGYDLTGNESGVCPECGQARGDT